MATLCIHVDDFEYNGITYHAQTDDQVGSGSWDSGLAGDNSTAFEAALNALKQALHGEGGDRYVGGCLIFSPGRYQFSRTLEVDRDSIWLVGCQTELLFLPSFEPDQSDDGYTAVRFTGESSADTNVNSGMSGILLNLAYVEGWADDPDGDPGDPYGLVSGTTCVGLVLHNVCDFTAWDLTVQNFTRGVVIEADGEDSTCNTFHVRYIFANYVGVQTSTTDGGRIMFLNFHGGRWGGAADPTLASPDWELCRTVSLEGDTSNVLFSDGVFEAGAWYHVGLGLEEGSEVTNVTFSGCRMETAGLSIHPEDVAEFTSDLSYRDTLLRSRAKYVTLVNCNLCAGLPAEHHDDVPPYKYDIYLEDGAGPHYLWSTLYGPACYDPAVYDLYDNPSGDVSDYIANDVLVVGGGGELPAECQIYGIWVRGYIRGVGTLNQYSVYSRVTTGS